MRSTIMANGEGCVKARTLLQRFRESPHVRVDKDVEDSAYSLKGVVQWMCSEGMCEEGDVDMTMQQKGGTYKPADFKKLLGTVARNGEMLVDGSKEELKSGAAEILVLSRKKHITQTSPEDFQNVPVIVADGVEYVLLDQLKMDSGPRVCDCGRPFMSLRTVSSHRARACPAVADERTHGKEVGVVDDAGLSSIGAVNLVSDESEDVEAPENVDGEGGTFKEQQPRPVESFDSSRKLATLIFSARGSVEWISNLRNGSKVSLPSSQGEISKLKERNESPPATPAPRNRASGVENHPTKTPEKRSREDGMSKVHRRTKKRITYKKDRMVEMIDLRASDAMDSAAREEAEEEHDQSISEKSNGEENEATSDEGGDCETSDGRSRDTHNADDEDGRSSDGTAQDEGGDGAGEDDRSADGRESSPSPRRTRRMKEPESGGEGGATGAPPPLTDN
ncbi:hypothetical protein CBR_g39049 [Chara braunii]|uniref:Uncharacterized protein n=1 Tax=Chara braunii TaxID=69332 RepID=A0A388LQT3_CHABU|nr:hypothetical protein CBR_g39049 [Chara braunii]|eukprot:GBG84674.1 hypothetical protein CBR_g39049 [Chara braunii]